MTRRLWLFLPLTLLLLVFGWAMWLLLNTSPLRGTHWQLIDPPSMRPITLEFDRDRNRFGGWAGCNGYGAGYRQLGPLLLIDGVMHTLMGCGGGVVEHQEISYLRALGSVKRYRSTGDRLTLFSLSGQIVLTFERVP